MVEDFLELEAGGVLALGLAHVPVGVAVVEQALSQQATIRLTFSLRENMYRSVPYGRWYRLFLSSPPLILLPFCRAYEIKRGPISKIQFA